MAVKAFDRFADHTSRWTGHPITFAASCVSVVGWAAAGPIYHWSDTWQLVANTATTIITFLMIFVVQASQNRNSCAMQAKLDELIKATNTAHDEMIGIERQPEEEIERHRPTA